MSPKTVACCNEENATNVCSRGENLLQLKYTLIAPTGPTGLVLFTLTVYHEVTTKTFGGYKIRTFIFLGSSAILHPDLLGTLNCISLYSTQFI